MSGRSSLSREQLTIMCELREQGWAVRKIANWFTDRGTPIGAGGIYWQCLRLGAEPATMLRAPPTTKYQRGPGRPFSAAEDACLLRLEGEGMTYSQIGRRLHRRHSSIIARLMVLARDQARAEDIGGELLSPAVFASTATPIEGADK